MTDANGYVRAAREIFEWSSIKDTYDNKPSAHRGTLEDLFAWLDPGERRRGHKKDGRALLGTTFSVGSHDDPEKNPGERRWRLLSRVSHVDLLMLDYDDARDSSGAPMTREALGAPWAGFARISWSTYSHGRPGRGANVRGVFPLARSVSKGEHAALYLWAMAWVHMHGVDIFDGLDSACSDATRLMYTPRDINPDSDPAEHWCTMARGALLDPDALPGGGSVAELAPVIELLACLEPRRSDGKPKQHLASALARVLSGRVKIEDLERERQRREDEKTAQAEKLQAAIEARAAEKKGRSGGAVDLGDASGALLRYCGVKAARSALDNAVSAIQSAGKGQRHGLILSWSRALGGYLRASYLDDDGKTCDLGAFDAQEHGRASLVARDPREELLAAAGAAYGEDFSKSNATKTIDDGLAFGDRQPWHFTAADLSQMTSKSAPSAATVAAFLKANKTRSARQLAAAQKAGATARICATRYFRLPEITPTSRHRTIFMRGVQGTGKTTAIAALIKALDSSRPVIYVSLRVSLCADAARRLELTSYKDISGEIDLARTPRLAICADSLHRIQGWSEATKPALVILDESEQLARHIFGDTIAGSRRTTSLNVYDILRALIGHADLTIAADADLDAGSLELVRGERWTPENCSGELWVINPLTPQRRVIMAERGTDLLADLFDFLPDAEAPVAVQCTSCKEATRLAKILAGETVDSASAAKLEDEIRTMHARLTAKKRALRVLLITQDTTGEQHVKDWLANNATYRGDYDVIISSPTLATGVSIDWQVARVYGLATWVRGYTAEDFAQQLWRYRQIEDSTWRVWVQKRFDDLPERWSDVDRLGRAGSRTVDRLGALMRPRIVEGRLVRTPADAAHWSLYCTVTARKNALSSYMYGAWLRLCVDREYAVEDLEQLDDAGRARIDDHRALATEIIKAEHAAAIYEGEQIPWKQAEAIFARGASSPEERHAAERALIARSIRDRVPVGHKQMTREDIGEYLDGFQKKGKRAALHMLIALACAPNDRQAIARAALAAMGEHAAANGLWEEREGAGKKLTDALCLAKLLEVAGVDVMRDQSYTLEGAISQPLLESRGLVDWINDHRERIERVMTLRAGWQGKLVRVVSDVLKKLGVKLIAQQMRVSSPEGDQHRVRVYHLDPERRQTILKWSTPTLERLLASGERHLERVAEEALSHHPDLATEAVTSPVKASTEQGVEAVTSHASGSTVQTSAVTKDTPNAGPDKLLEVIADVIAADPIADPTLGELVGELAARFGTIPARIKGWLDRLRRAGETDCDLVRRLASA